MGPIGLGYEGLYPVGGLCPTTFFLSTSLSMPEEIMPTRSNVCGLEDGSGIATFGCGLGEVIGVVSLDTGGVVPLVIFIGDTGDLMLDSRSESSASRGLSEKLLREELGLEVSLTQLDLGVSALEDGLEELFFLGDRVSSS